MTKNVIILILLFSPLILAAFQNPSTQSISEKNAEQDRLKEILNKTGEYCRLLEKAAIDFIFFEEVAEIAQRYKSRPDITIITEFSFEKNAVRFPGNSGSLRPILIRKERDFSVQKPLWFIEIINSSPSKSKRVEQ